ncbi:hypothetical protein BGX27_004277 [Mortierella sp. AM989]|nr:hypothetical protein BGX27_004277 [Mortierella sp. AM989]
MVLASKLPLPDECIDLIVAYLVDDRQTLHALVLSSQKLFQRTAPILYRSPFRLIEQSFRWSREEKEKRTTALLALLLTSTDGHVSTESPPLTESPPATKTTVIIRQDKLHAPHPPTTLVYLGFYIYQYHVDLWRPLVNLRAMPSIRDVFILDQSKGMTVLQNQVAASLIEYRPEDIKVIGQPIGRATLILVPQIKRLRNLVRLELSEIPYGCKIEPILEFIRVHDNLHHTLREIKIKGGEDLNRHLEPTHTQLVRLVQAMLTPQVVDARHWREAILILHQIPQECLRTLLLGMADMPPSNIRVADYLELCVCLEELRMPVRDERVFAWAIAARAAMEKERNVNSSRQRSLQSKPSMTTIASPTLGSGLVMPAALVSSVLPTSSPLLQKSPWHLRHHSYSEWNELEEKQGMARLKYLELCGEDSCLIPALRDATDAFRDSLETLKAQSLAILMTMEPVQSSIPLSWSWSLPHLSELDLEGEVASAFDFSALELCPVLTTLRLTLPPYMYSSSEDDDKLVEMRARMSKICLAKRLLDLKLYGKWPVSDELLENMTTNMTRLTSLSIVQCSEYTLEGIQTLIEDMKRLESLSINKWLCMYQPMRGKLQGLKASNSRLDVVEL